MIHGAGFLFDGVQPADTPQGFFGCRVGTADLKVKELAPRMRPAAQFDNHLPILAREQLLVSAIVVHHEAALPALQEIPCMLAGPAALIIEHHNRQAGIQIVAAVTPQVRPFGLARPRIQLLDRGFVGIQHLPLFEQFHQPVHQRLQGKSDATYPFAQGAAGQADLLPCGNLFQAAQRQVIQKLANSDPGQQAGGCQRPVDDCGGNGRCRDGFALTADILRADMADHEELRRFHIQLLADILVDLDEFGLTLRAGAGLGFVAHFDPFQMSGMNRPGF